MARTKKEVTEDQEEDKKKSNTPESKLAAIFNANKNDHYNFEEEVYYQVSSGSLNLDLEIEGLNPGCHRFLGIDSGGKTSASLNFLNNFLKDPKDRRGVYFKAEGRLSPQVRLRSGVNFVFNTQEWLDGTCLVVESNVFEFCFQIVRELILDRASGKKCFFIFDSADGLVRRDDLAKPLEDAEKVAGGAVITSAFLKKAGIALSKRGHIAIFIAQIRDTIKASQYVKITPKHGSSTGGNAIKHYADLVMDFLPRNKEDLILESGKIVGHWCKVKILKSSNEKNQVEVKYPIRYGRTGGKSVWAEYEIIDILLMYSLLEKKGGWFEFEDEFYEKMCESNNSVEISKKVQGIDNLRRTLEDNQGLTNWLFGKIKEII